MAGLETGRSGFSVEFDGAFLGVAAADDPHIAVLCREVGPGGNPGLAERPACLLVLPTGVLEFLAEETLDPVGISHTCPSTGAFKISVASEPFIPFRYVESTVQATGHVGAALLVTTPLTFVLTVAGAPEMAALGLAVAVAVASVPDWDQSLPVEHRGPTHTVWFVAVVALVAAGSGWVVAPQVGVMAGTAVALSLTSHLLADSITPMGIRPFAPLSNREFCFDIVRAANRRANWLLFGAGVAVTALSQGIVALVA